jgi:hypothetical protein
MEQERGQRVVRQCFTLSQYKQKIFQKQLVFSVIRKRKVPPPRGRFGEMKRRIMVQNVYSFPMFVDVCRDTVMYNRQVSIVDM